jgi:hypothetical protein
MVRKLIPNYGYPTWLKYSFLGIVVISFLTLFVYKMCETDTARSALVVKGYRDVEVAAEPTFFVCGNGSFGHEVTAIDPQGFPYQGTVCCNVFGTCTIEL